MIGWLDPRPIHRFARKHSGVDIDLNREAPSTGYAFVLVGRKPTHCYVRYMEDCINRGIFVFYVAARGASWIAKSHAVALDLMRQERVSLFRKQHRCELFGEQTQPVMLLTLVTARFPARLPRQTLDDNDLNYWKNQAAEHQRLRRAAALSADLRAIPTLSWSSSLGRANRATQAPCADWGEPVNFRSARKGFDGASLKVADFGGSLERLVRALGEGADR